MTRTESSPLLAVATDEEVARLAAYAARIAPKMTADLTQGKPDRAVGYVRYYAWLCRTVGLDPVLAIAQTWVESTYWSSWWFGQPRRNPAGIGVNGAVLDLPVPGGQWQRRDDGKWAKGHAYPTYAAAAMSHVHGLALWAGANPEAIKALGQRARMAGIVPYSPPANARGSARTPLELGFAYNPKGIGWAHPGRALALGKKGQPGYRLIDANEARALGKTYGHSIARVAREALA